MMFAVSMSDDASRRVVARHPQRLDAHVRRTRQEAWVGDIDKPTNFLNAL